MNWQGSWIWTDMQVPKRNVFVRFRRTFTWQNGTTYLHITADARYVLYVNGLYLGQGPIRAWPAHWKYDTYDLTPYLTPDNNVIAVLVNAYGEGNFQYIPGPPGLLAQLEFASGDVIGTDAQWLVSPDPAFISATPRISLQSAFEEQYDACRQDDWTQVNYPATAWRQAVVVNPVGAPPHTSLEPRDIPQLTLIPVLPKRLVSAEVVRSRYHRWHMHVKPYLFPHDVSANRMICHAYLYTQVWSDAAHEVRLVQSLPVKINGTPVEHGGIVTLQPGWNEVLLRFPASTHAPYCTFVLDGPEQLCFAYRREAGGAPWAVLGPFGLTEQMRKLIDEHVDESVLIGESRDSGATAQLGEDIWQCGHLNAELLEQSFVQPIQTEHLPTDVFLQCYYDEVLPDAPKIEQATALLSDNHEWCIIHPNSAGDIRLLFDFGQEVVGYHRFEVDGPTGTILDWHNFEFIQPDGRYNFAEGMNNTCRYIMREGPQQYQTSVRRGFQYSYLTIRNLTAPLRIRLVEVLFNTYPQTAQGCFACSDAQLDRIWLVGAHSLRCCAEDTYVDCPTYEQTHWVGDARNEALVDWVVNGDSRLWYHCLEQAGQSLSRSDMVESHVPSAWTNLLPAWSFLWMRSCREYLLYTGDFTKARRLLEFVRRNVAGMCKYIDARGLFNIRAWNMFDWATMDTPNRGVITHLNCFAVLALNECAEFAEWLDAPADAAAWRSLATSIAQAANDHLWSETRQAYADCLRGDTLSAVFSQQTQTVAYISGVAQGERARLCRQYIYSPPADFVRAGSPFFEFFLLEALAKEGRSAELIATVRKDWGFMVDKGATTFWEMWSRRLPGGRLTRSHCHGWSAAPTFFLATYVLGVQPLAPGFVRFKVAPKLGDLAWCRGSIPTPHGLIQVRWEHQPDATCRLEIDAPKQLEPVINLGSHKARVILNGVELS